MEDPFSFVTLFLLMAGLTNSNMCHFSRAIFFSSVQLRLIKHFEKPLNKICGVIRSFHLTKGTKGVKSVGQSRPTPFIGISVGKKYSPIWHVY